MARTLTRRFYVLTWLVVLGTFVPVVKSEDEVMAQADDMARKIEEESKKVEAQSNAMVSAIDKKIKNVDDAQLEKKFEKASQRVDDVMDQSEEAVDKKAQNAEELANEAERKVEELGRKIEGNRGSRKRSTDSLKSGKLPRRRASITSKFEVPHEPSIEQQIDNVEDEGERMAMAVYTDRKKNLMDVGFGNTDGEMQNNMVDFDNRLGNFYSNNGQLQRDGETENNFHSDPEIQASFAQNDDNVGNTMEDGGGHESFEEGDGGAEDNIHNIQASFARNDAMNRNKMEDGGDPENFFKNNEEVDVEEDNSNGPVAHNNDKFGNIYATSEMPFAMEEGGNRGNYYTSNTELNGETGKSIQNQEIQEPITQYVDQNAGLEQGPNVERFSDGLNGVSDYQDNVQRTDKDNYQSNYPYKTSGGNEEQETEILDDSAGENPNVDVVYTGGDPLEDVTSTTHPSSKKIKSGYLKHFKLLDGKDSAKPSSKKIKSGYLKHFTLHGGKNSANPSSKKIKSEHLGYFELHYANRTANSSSNNNKSGDTVGLASDNQGRLKPDIINNFSQKLMDEIEAYSKKNVKHAEKQEDKELSDPGASKLDKEIKSQFRKFKFDNRVPDKFLHWPSLVKNPTNDDPSKADTTNKQTTNEQTETHPKPQVILKVIR